MRPLLPLLLFAAFAPAADEPKLIDAPKPPDGFPKFKVQEIDAGLKIGYAVITADINGDKKPDIVVVDQHKVVWYENRRGRSGSSWTARRRRTTCASRRRTSTATGCRSWWWGRRGSRSTPRPPARCNG